MRTAAKFTKSAGKKEVLVKLSEIIMKMSLRSRLLHCFAACVLYTLLVYLFYSSAGKSAAILIVIPAIIIPVFFGPAKGTLSAVVLSFGINPVLFWLCAPPGKNLNFTPEFVLGNIATIFIALIIGIFQKLLLQIHLLNSKLYEISIRDGLTSLLNRRAFWMLAERELKLTRRQKGDLEYFVSADAVIPRAQAQHKKNRIITDYFGVAACVVIDLDLFKHINDTQGHLAGDDVLRYIGEIIGSGKYLRDTDLSGRFGGEEFILFLPGTSGKNAVIAVEKIRNVFTEKAFSGTAGLFKADFSAGISQAEPDDNNIDVLVARADKALYTAKANGRGRTVLYGEENTAGKADSSVCVTGRG